MDSLASIKMDFEEFCAAAIRNLVISAEELKKEMNLGASSYSLPANWIREYDGKLSFVGFTKFLHGITIRSSNTRQGQDGS
ncbi:hypothetical protein K1719_025431 [Acacia pycnantha]|nr:hypothetical protein K1719_025431 [Acacia pycnantha]